MPKSRNPFRRRHRSSTTSEPPPPDAYEELIKHIYAPSPLLTALSILDPEAEPPARYTAEQLASKLYSPQGEPITEDELFAIRASDPKYRLGTWVVADGHGGKIMTDYHGIDHRERPTTPRPWRTFVGQENGVPRFICAWPDEETAVRGHGLFVKEMTDVGAVEFIQVSTLEALHEAASEPDRPF